MILTHERLLELMCYDKSTGQFRRAVQIVKDYKTKTIGYFAKKKDAIQARRAAELELFGEFAAL